MQLDTFMGRLTKKLEELNIADNTVVVFASDNGCSTIVDIPKLKSMGHYPSYIYRGHKSCIWEGGHRIPFIVKWPGHIPAGTSDALTCLTDMYATFAQLLGAAYREDTAEDSVSNLSLWLGDPAAVRADVIHHSVNGFFAIRNKEWKLEMCAGSGGNAFPRDLRKEEIQDLPPIQLYHIPSDPGEQNNVSDQHPQIIAQLKEKLTEDILRGRSTPGPDQQNAPCENWPGLEWMQA